MLSFLLSFQLIVVVSSNWDSSVGTLYCFDRSSDCLQWNLYLSPTTVNLGKNGMAVGQGIHKATDLLGVQKEEGDKRSPAGIFRLGPTFGNIDYRDYSKKMPFLLITDDLEWVDDVKSIYYNQAVYSKLIHNIDWKSSEKMKQFGYLYNLGIFVQHNTDPIILGKGSAIFMHIWEAPDIRTSGCIAMAEKDLIEIVSWLKVEKNPSLIVLPMEEYLKKKLLWGLPDLPSFEN